MKFVILFALFFVSSVFCLSEEVRLALKNGKTANVWIQLTNKKFNPRAPEHLSGLQTRDERRVAHYKVMTEYAHRMQAPLKSFLSQQQGVSYKSFWITNAFVIYDATELLIDQIETIFTDVEEIYLEQSASIEVPVDNHFDETVINEYEVKRAGWNIEMTNAPVAWSSNYTGVGFVVGNIDTGVRWTHTALAANYRGYGGSPNTQHDYNWLDPRGEPIPFDNNGHGTHVMGTMVGSVASGVGMAFGSTWIAAKGCASSSCSQADLTASGEFMAAPCNYAGTDCQPTLAPHVVQNSWGGGGGQTWFHPIIDSWLAMDIVPSFSAGNSGSGCSTIGSPSDYRYAISVASMDQQARLSSFSSRGPGPSGTAFEDQKPDITGPGSSIRSAWNTNDNAYNTISGTSMSGPHIAAASVLFLGPLGNTGNCPTTPRSDPSCGTQYDCQCVDFVRHTMDVSSSSDFGAPTGGLTSCSGVPYTQIPNYHYGFGMLDVAEGIDVVKKILNSK